MDCFQDLVKRELIALCNKSDNTKNNNLNKMDEIALKNLSNQDDITIRRMDNGGAVTILDSV